VTDRELMQQALDALELLAWCENPATRVQVRKPRNGGSIVTVYPHKVATDAAAPLRERLAQPEQEPVANIRIWHKNGEQHAELWNWDKGIETLPDGYYDLYTTPPQREPLTDEEIERACVPLGAAMLSFTEVARAIEAAHGIKGEA
jgi:hypothetical protein